MPTVIPASEAKARFSELLQRSLQGECFAITLHGEEVANLVPAKRSSLEDIRKAVEQMEALQSGTILNPEGEVRLTIKELVEEGRP